MIIVIIVHYFHVLMEITCRGGRKNMSVYESGINGEKTAGMMHRLVHYLNKLKELKFVLYLEIPSGAMTMLVKTELLCMDG